MHKTKRLPNFVQELDDLLTNPNKEMSNKLNEENVQAEKTKKMPYNLREKKINNQSLYNFSLGNSSIKRLEGIYNGSLTLNFSIKE